MILDYNAPLALENATRQTFHWMIEVKVPLLNGNSPYSFTNYTKLVSVL
jgi:hypothetical protein